ncbi:MAG: hypothetical protein WCO54_01700 [Bacteroidota bacterium]
METSKQKVSRKKFVFWGLGIATSFSVLKYAFTKKEKKPNLVKMLTEDGKLVEVDASLLNKNKKKISNTELQEWIKK